MLKRLKAMPGKYYAAAGAAHASLFFSGASHASGRSGGLAQFFSNWKDEGDVIFPIVMWAFAAVGVVLMGSSAWTFIQAKKNREAPTWQVYGFFGGAFLTVIGAFALMITASSGAESSALTGLKL